MTDEQTTETPAEEPQEQSFPIINIWNAYYETALAILIGNTVNKADKQQYRLKAADVATGLTALSVR